MGYILYPTTWFADSSAMEGILLRFDDLLSIFETILKDGVESQGWACSM